VAVGFGLYAERDYLFVYSAQQTSRALYGSNPFPEAVEVGRYIKEHSAPSDRVAVFGSEPEIYFYADRTSASGYIYMYDLMEDQPYAEQLQLAMIREVEAAEPKYVVMVDVSDSWLVRKTSPRAFFGWGPGYVGTHYVPVGLVDILNPTTTRYVWEKELAGYVPQSRSRLTVYRRK
jgi:hypothetical protein